MGFRQVAEPAAVRVASLPPGLPPVPLKQSSSPVSPDLPLYSKDPREHRGQKGRSGGAGQGEGAGRHQEQQQRRVSRESLVAPSSAHQFYTTYEQCFSGIIVIVTINAM